MTEKLYYADSHMQEFTATVLSCEAGKGCWLIELDRTAFFPEGGGQPSDSGYIGKARVSQVHEKAGRILHYADMPLVPGENLLCKLDWEKRFRRMQNHSGEHVFSGVCHRLYGCDNVGFHMGEDCMTIDFSKELSWQELSEAETLANRVVSANLPVKTFFPQGEELAELEYRSKLELTENVRIVEIPGADRCACCAPHVSFTGEIGLIKLLSAERHRGGVRISLVCGMDALEDCRVKQDNISAISNLLSAKRHETAKAVERLLSEQTRYKERIAAVSMELARLKAGSVPETEGNICVFDSVLDEVALRELVNLLCEKCGGMAGAFSGNDAEGYRYIIGSRKLDLRAKLKTINAGIGGKGGGSREMIQGRASFNAETIKAFFAGEI